MSDYAFDETELVRLKEKAQADALSGVFTLPFAVVNGSALDKLKKAAFNKAYEDTYHGKVEMKILDEVAVDATVQSLEEQYEAKFGKKPHWKMKVETIQAALEE